jgi:hypothetical protein
MKPLNQQCGGKPCHRNRNEAGACSNGRPVYKCRLCALWHVRVPKPEGRDEVPSLQK